jgi:hypothetical protein
MDRVDIEAVPDIVIRLGRELDATIRLAELQVWKPQTKKVGQFLGHLF